MSISVQSSRVTSEFQYYIPKVNTLPRNNPAIRRNMARPRGIGSLFILNSPLMFYNLQSTFAWYDRRDFCVFCRLFHQCRLCWITTVANLLFRYIPWVLFQTSKAYQLYSVHNLLRGYLHKRYLNFYEFGNECWRVPFMFWQSNSISVAICSEYISK